MNQTDIQEIDVPKKSETELMQEKISAQLASAKQGFEDQVRQSLGWAVMHLP